MSDFPVVLTNAADGVPGVGTPILAKHLNNLEAKVGIDNSAVVTTLDYLLKNTASIEPGHKHSVLWASDGSLVAVTADAAGNIGIGTTSPQDTLHLSVASGGSNTPITPIIFSRYWASPTNTRAASIFEFSDGVTDKLAFGVAGDGGSYNAPNSIAQAKMVVQSDGNVGIGTTNATANLHIVGTFLLAGTKLKITDTLTLGLVSEVNGQLISYGSNFSQLTTVNASYAGGFFRIDLRDSYAAEFFSVKYVPAGGAETTPLMLSRTGDIVATGKLTISGAGNSSIAGNVGIGTTNPTYKLQTMGTIAIGDDTFGLANPILKFNTTTTVWLTQAVSGDYRISQSGIGDMLAILQTTGIVGIGTIAPVISGTGKLHMAGDTIRLDTARTPASAGAAGNVGEVCWDSGFIYVCVATNTWKKAAISTW
jgi:hypothetical protein